MYDEGSDIPALHVYPGPERRSITQWAALADDIRYQLHAHVEHYGLSSRHEIDEVIIEFDMD
jgi:hypothetical protein